MKLFQAESGAKSTAHCVWNNFLLLLLLNLVRLFLSQRSGNVDVSFL